MAKKKRVKKPPGRKQKITTVGSLRQVIATVTDSKKPLKDRLVAANRLLLYDDEKTVETMLTLLRNRQEPIESRRAVLHALRAANFSFAALQARRGDYMAALRELADDPDPDVRQRVLGTLARHKDGFVQKKLLEGLRDPSRALVSPEKALQLLSYDAHADAYAVARAIVDGAPNPDAKREALRLLAADATSAPLLEKVLRDKNERADIRQLSAAALHAVNPQRMQACARDLLIDENEYPEIQTTSLTAITQFGRETTLSGDEKLLKSVERLSVEKVGELKQRAEQFLGRYRK
jgi:hypothetical protein